MQTGILLPTQTPHLRHRSVQEMPAPTASPDRKPLRKLPEFLPRREERHEPSICICARCSFERLRKVGETCPRSWSTCPVASKWCAMCDRPTPAQVRGDGPGAEADDADPACGRCQRARARDRLEVRRPPPTLPPGATVSISIAAHWPTGWARRRGCCALSLIAWASM
jgi:hypothetical protein